MSRDIVRGRSSGVLVALTLALSCGGDDVPGTDGGRTDGGRIDGGGASSSSLPPFICSTYEDCPMALGGADDSSCTELFPGGACLLDSTATCEDTVCPTGSACVRFLGDLYCLRTCAQGCKTGQTCNAAEGVCVPADCSSDESVCGPYSCTALGPGRVCARPFCSSVGDCPPPLSCNRARGICEEPRYTSSSR